MNAYEVNPSANTFFFSGYIWISWTGTNETDMSASVELKLVDTFGLIWRRILRLWGI